MSQQRHIKGITGKILSKRMMDIMHNSSDGCLYMDGEGKLIYSNPVAQKTFRQQLLFRDMWEGLPQSKNSMAYAACFRALKEQKDITFDVQPSQERFRVFVYPEEDGLFITFKSITKEEDELDRLHTLGKMAAEAAHEIQNPITIVKGYLQLLKIKKESEGHLNEYNTMIGELDRVNQILTNFLSLSNKKAVDLKSHNLNGIIQKLLPFLQARAEEEHKHIETDLRDIPDILIDENEIRQLIINMVKNGLEAVSAGGKVEILTEDKKHQVILTIKDNGNGIDSGILPVLGTPFATTKEKGHGLGMAICQSIALRNKARIDYETGPKGACFHVHFYGVQ